MQNRQNKEKGPLRLWKGRWQLPSLPSIHQSSQSKRGKGRPPCISGLERAQESKQENLSPLQKCQLQLKIHPVPKGKNPLPRHLSHMKGGLLDLPHGRRR